MRAVKFRGSQWKNLKNFFLEISQAFYVLHIFRLKKIKSISHVKKHVFENENLKKIISIQAKSVR